MEQEIKALKTRLVSATDFGDVLNTFLDLDLERLIEVSEPYQEQRLLQTVAGICADILDTSVLMLQGLLLRVDAQRFVHGSFVVGARLATLIYFEDLDLGLVSVCMGGDETRLARFRSVGPPELN